MNFTIAHNAANPIWFGVSFVSNLTVWGWKGRVADWLGAYYRNGITGVISEFVACVTSHNVPTIRVSRYSHWRGIDIERLLKRHGVKVWDRGLAGDSLYFCVKRRQVKWAEYLLLRAGVPVTSVLNEPRNCEYTKRYPPGFEPLK